MTSNCGGCGKPAGAGTVQCKGCDLWWHQNCSGMPKPMYDLIIMTVDQCGTHCWCCRVCASVQDGIKKSIIALNVQVNEMDEKITANTSDIKSNKDNLEVLNNKFDNLESTATKSADKDEIFKEIREREARKVNIILHGVPEPVGEAADRGKKDKQEIKSIAAAVNVKLDQNADIKFAYRTGEKPKETDAKPRPLRVGFHDRNKAQRLIDDAWKLKDNKKLKYTAYIASDLTVQQREEEKQMRKEVEEKNNDLASDDEYHFQVVGKRGHRIIAKVRKRQKDTEEENLPGTSSKKRPLSPETNRQTQQAEKTAKK